MNIFQKDCPQCAAINPVDAVNCDCGYCFDPEALARTNPAEYAHQQDRLYRDYLAARIAQAEAELIVAREQLKADPGNTYKASGVLLAEQALNALRAEMKQLTLRLSASASRRAASLAPAATRREKTPIAKPVERAHVEPAPLSMQAAAAAPKIAAAMKQTSAAKRVAVPAPKPAPVSRPEPAPRRAAAPKPHASPEPQTRVTPPPAVTMQPDEIFKRRQAERAEAIVRAKTALVKTAPAAAGKPREIKPPSQPAPARVPPLLSATAASTQECPNCTATVPADRKRCRCGYTFSRAAEEVPPITLDAAALAILTQGVSSTKTKRTTRR